MDSKGKHSSAIKLTHLAAELIAKMIRRSEEHTSELQSRLHLVCRLLLEKKKTSDPQTLVDTRSHLARPPAALTVTIRRPGPYQSILQPDLIHACTHSLSSTHTIIRLSQ